MIMVAEPRFPYAGAHVAQRVGGRITPGPLAVARRLNDSIVGALLLL
jgi:hypothetical protein